MTMKPKDYIALGIIIISLILVSLGYDGAIAATLAAIVAYEFGRRTDLRNGH